MNQIHSTLIAAILLAISPSFAHADDSARPNLLASAAHVVGAEQPSDAAQNAMRLPERLPFIKSKQGRAAVAGIVLGVIGSVVGGALYATAQSGAKGCVDKGWCSPEERSGQHNLAVGSNFAFGLAGVGGIMFGVGTVAYLVQKPTTTESKE